MLFGIDTSHHNGEMDYARARGEGVAFMVNKATEGTTFVDTTCSRRVAAARAAGLVVGVYHWLHQADPVGQVHHFLDTVGSVRGLLVQLDWEHEIGFADASPSTARTWVNMFRAETGNHPVLIYNPGWFWRDYLGSPGGLSDLGPLWESHYVTGSGTLGGLAARVPASWWNGHDGWTRAKMLQYTDDATVAGVGKIDGNMFDGTYGELVVLSGGMTPSESVRRDEDMISGQLAKGEQAVVPMYDFDDGRVQHLALTAGLLGDGGPAVLRFVEHSWKTPGWRGEHAVDVPDGAFVNLTLQEDTDIVTLQRLDEADGVVGWVLAYDTK